MQNLYFLLTIFSSILFAVSAFVIIYIIKIRKEKSMRGLLLCFIILAITLRVGKSFFYFLFPEIDLIALIAGFTGHSLLPLFLINYFLKKEDKLLNSKNSYHIIFPITGILTILFLNKIFNTAYLFEALYLSSNIILSLYLVYIYINSKGKMDNIDDAIFKSIVALVIIFYLQTLISSLTFYTVGIGLATLIIYFLFYKMLKNPKKLVKKVNTVFIKPEYRVKIIEQLSLKEHYLDSKINLTQFSSRIAIPKYIVSKVIAEEYKLSFPEVINKYRVKEVTEKLMDPDTLDFKIESLAFDVGFNTTSNFYNAFKKETGMSPREFQKSILI